MTKWCKAAPTARSTCVRVTDHENKKVNKCTKGWSNGIQRCICSMQEGGSEPSAFIYVSLTQAGCPPQQQHTSSPILLVTYQPACPDINYVSWHWVRLGREESHTYEFNSGQTEGQTSRKETQTKQAPGSLDKPEENKAYLGITCLKNSKFPFLIWFWWD